MDEIELAPWYRRAFDWLCFVPIWLAYRLVWLSARTGEPDAREVYRAMGKAGLDLPPIARLTQETIK